MSTKLRLAAAALSELWVFFQPGVHRIDDIWVE